MTHARVEPFGGGGTDFATRWLIEKSLCGHADAPTFVSLHPITATTKEDTNKKLFQQQ